MSIGILTDWQTLPPHDSERHRQFFRWPSGNTLVDDLETVKSEGSPADRLKSERSAPLVIADSYTT